MVPGAGACYQGAIVLIIKNGVGMDHPLLMSLSATPVPEVIMADLLLPHHGHAWAGCACVSPTAASKPSLHIQAEHALCVL
jgi:hypothetical protein